MTNELNEVKKELAQVKNALKNLMVTYNTQMAEVVAQHKDVATSLEEHWKQIQRRPVDLEQMRHVVYDDVEKQVERHLLEHITVFDRAIDNYFFDARLVPSKRISDVLTETDPNTLDVTLSGSIKEEVKKEMSKNT